MLICFYFYAVTVPVNAQVSFCLIITWFVVPHPFVIVNVVCLADDKFSKTVILIVWLPFPEELLTVTQFTLGVAIVQDVFELIAYFL